jgi:hypothetical protein
VHTITLEVELADTTLTQVLTLTVVR